MGNYSIEIEGRGNLDRVQSHSAQLVAGLSPDVTRAELCSGNQYRDLLKGETVGGFHLKIEACGAHGAGDESDPIVRARALVALLSEKGVFVGFATASCSDGAVVDLTAEAS